MICFYLRSRNWKLETNYKLLTIISIFFERETHERRRQREAETDRQREREGKIVRPAKREKQKYRYCER